MAKNHLAKGAASVIKREIETAVMRDRLEFAKVAVSVLNSIAVIVLNDKFDFEADKIKEFVAEFESQADCLIDDYVTLDDLKTLAEELVQKVHEIV